MNRIPVKEKCSFAFTMMGQTLVFNTVNLYLLIFYTDILGINPAAAGVLFMAARIWDAVNDPLMGVAVDKTSSRWGKCRPYLLFSPLPVVLTTVLLFLSPSWEHSAKLIYVSVTYILWGMVYTSLDIPLWTLSSRVSTDTSERQSLISWARVFNIIGSALPAILFVPLRNLMPSVNNDQGYLAAALVFCAAALPLMIQGFFGTKEHVPLTAEKRPGFSECMETIFSNKPLLLLLASNLLSLLVNLPVVAGNHFAVYNLGDDGMFPVLSGAVLTGAVFGSILAPNLARRYSPRNILIYSSLISAVFFTIAYFVPADSTPVLIFLAFVLGFLLGFPLVLRTSMLADTAEYAEQKTGKRSEGIIFSTLTFTGKLKMGASLLITGLVLKMTDFQPLAEQSVRTLTGIRMTMTLLPALGCILTIIPLLYYSSGTGRQQRQTA